MLIDIVKGLKYLHSLGIVHGDLKRANILRKSHAKGEICKITDLGMAHVVEDIDYYFSRNVAGDYAFMAPEAIFDGRVSAKMVCGSVVSAGNAEKSCALLFFSLLLLFVFFQCVFAQPFSNIDHG